MLARRASVISIWIACVSCLSYRLHSSVIDDITSRIQSDFTVDANNRPYYDKEIGTVGTCLEWKPWCLSTRFFDRYFLEEVSDVRVLYRTTVQEPFTNNGTSSHEMRFTISKTKSLGVTKGWKIGGRLSAGVDVGAPPLKGSAGLEMSSEYGESTAEDTSTTRLVQHNIRCEPGHYCALVTVTFNAAVKGICAVAPHFECGGKRNMCTNPSWTGCGPFFDSYNRCDCDGYAGYVPCEAQFPIFNDNGEPLSHVVSIAKRLGS
ncbi:hypothetical protein HRG_010692 [Hirsutella rhossiliensis]|uniref:Uncharacterized protein n=1 Tax=Hirsutella rhossiliensis TaxID=111463 RepID=A0A9P8MQM0_9HYPO|nr:uncharacterized protein HRG_10692 [Hirsutella rhossiliensis]KAH0958391.1 hypothetical protein HRG_10692 [Hirsutella rhossiliensis]